jgi:FAD synthetase
MISPQDPFPKQDDSRVNGVKDTTSVTDAAARRSFPEICDELRRKVAALLGKQTDDEGLRNVQNQVRISMRVITEALERYR